MFWVFSRFWNCKWFDIYCRTSCCCPWILVMKLISGLYRFISSVYRFIYRLYIYETSNDLTFWDEQNLHGLISFRFDQHHTMPATELCMITSEICLYRFILISLRISQVKKSVQKLSWDVCEVCPEIEFLSWDVWSWWIECLTCQCSDVASWDFELKPILYRPIRFSSKNALPSWAQKMHLISHD
jgi:hypothetical protein